VIRHTVVFRFAEGTPAERVQAIREALMGLPGRVPEVRSFSCGGDLGLREGNADFAIVAEFDDEEGWRAYQDDPEHQRIIRELIAPVTEQRLAAQITA
jgi:hypothetical protein